MDVNENLADKVLQELNTNKVLFCKADVAKKDEFEGKPKTNLPLKMSVYFSCF